MNVYPPESWVGNIEDDGYEYIEYPSDSGNNFYRSQGESQWKKWNDGESQEAFSTDFSTNQPPLSSSPTITPAFTPSYQPSSSPPTITPAFTPSYSPSSSPPFGSPPSSYSGISGAPYRDNFATMDYSSKRNKSRSGLKIVVGVIFVFALLIILPSILYVWASELASDEYSDSDEDEWFEDTDYDIDGVDDDWDNCVYDYNPNQENFDGDSKGDACDSDIDGDGYLNSNDFHDYGNGIIIFKWSYARINDSDTYDSDSSGPDVYAKLFVDWDSDGETDSTYTSDTINNIKEWSNLYEKELNPSDDRSQIKVTVRLYDEDYSSDDELDYVAGSYTAYVYTIPLSESYYESETTDGRDGDNGLKVTFIWDADAQ